MADAMGPATSPVQAPHRGVRFGLRWRFTGYITFLTLLVMVSVVGVVTREIRKTLEHQIQERGLALARNLAASCVEPMQLKDDRTLALMLFVKEYVQSGGGKAAVDRLGESMTMRARVWGYVRQLGQEDDVEGIRNEGVLTAVVSDQASTIVAFADARVDPAEWLDRVDHPYQPEAETGLLSPGEEAHIWNSRSRGGIYQIAVPIVPPRTDQPTAPAAVTGEPGAKASGTAAAPEAAAAQIYGTVYLAISQGLVHRTVARAIAVLILFSIGLVAIGVLVAVIIAAFLTKPIRLLQQGVRAIAGGDFKSRIAIKRRDELGDLTDAFNDMARGLEEREVMRGAFSTYVSKDLLAEIVKNPEAMKLGGSRKDATVMFTFFGNHHELPGLMARLEPEAIVGIINAYLEVQATLIAKHKGHLDKFVGEEVMGVWGTAPVIPDHAEWAVRCAVAIQEEVAKLNVRRAREGLMTTDISIGINSGSMVVGNMGSADGKRDYTVISSDVNFAARLSGAGAEIHGGEVWLGENTFQAVQGLVEIREKRMVSFKGIAGAQPVYVLAGMKGAAVPAGR